MQSDEEVQKYTDALLGAIKNSQAYTDYAAAREEILKYPDRKQKADQFRRIRGMRRPECVRNSTGSGSSCAWIRLRIGT